jgi:hypothetical protein
VAISAHAASSQGWRGLSPTTPDQREIERGQALRELSRAERQLLAALAGLGAADQRDREAAAEALSHAEGRVAHALSALEQMASEERAATSGLRSPVQWQRGREQPEPAAAGAPPGREAAAWPRDQLSAYAAEVADLARESAADVEDLRALLGALAELREQEAAGADTSQAAGTSEEGPLGHSPHRNVLRRLTEREGQTALDDLSASLSAIEQRLQAASEASIAPQWRAALPALQPAEASSAGLSIEARLTAIEERLTALERRLRWMESPPGGPLA